MRERAAAFDNDRPATVAVVARAAIRRPTRSSASSRTWLPWWTGSAALLDAGDKEGVVTTFMREVPRVPPDQLERMRALPAWRARVAAAATIPRELRAHE